MIPLQLFMLDEEWCLCLVEESNKLVVLNVKETSKTKTIVLDTCPVSITREGDEVVVMTQDLRFFTVTLKDGEVVTNERVSSLTEALKETHCMVWEADET